MRLRIETIRLAWLGAAVVVVALPHFGALHAWVPALLCGVIAWRLIAAERVWRMPPASVRIPLAFAGFAAVAASYHSITGIEAGTALLVVMIAMKLLETRTARDRAVIAIICFVLMFAAFLREQAVWSFGYLFAGVFLCMLALMHAESGTLRLRATQGLRQITTILLQALPLMAVLFILFPRVPGPFWALPVNSGGAMTGLGDTVSPGDISELGRSDAVAFRVRFDAAVPPPEQRYWRGPVMSYFNGRVWSWQPRGTSQPDPRLAAAGGPAYRYELTLEPHRRRWLLALESPLSWDERDAFMSMDWQLVHADEVGERFSYNATSVASGRIPANESARYLQAMTYLPPDNNPRTRRLALELRNSASSDREYLAKAFTMFRTEEFFYTLTPPRLGDNATDQFLFDTRSGFCEHYASAFAFMARAGGIPARLVTGYLGGEHNTLGDYWIVRQSDAHAWVEVWLDGNWQRYDPTAAVAPERIDLGMDSAIPEAGRGALTLMRRSPVLGDLLLSIDAVNAAWDQWVLGFGPETQLGLLARLGIDQPGPRQLVYATLAACGLFLVWLVWQLRPAGKGPADPVAELYGQFCGRLARAFRPRRKTEGPLDYAAAAAAELPAEAGEITAITRLYIEARYENNGGRPDIELLRNRVRMFRPDSAG